MKRGSSEVTMTGLTFCVWNPSEPMTVSARKQNVTSSWVRLDCGSKLGSAAQKEVAYVVPQDSPTTPAKQQGP